MQEKVNLHAEEGPGTKRQISGKHSISAVAIFTFLGYNFLLKKTTEEVIHENCSPF